MSNLSQNKSKSWTHQQGTITHHDRAYPLFDVCNMSWALDSFQNATQTSCIRRRSCSSQEGETTSGNHHIS